MSRPGVEARPALGAVRSVRHASRVLGASCVLLVPFLAWCAGTEASKGTRLASAEQTQPAQGRDDELSSRPVPHDVREMLREMNPRNVESTIRTLVSFGTRNTLSVQDDPARGIGAARDWLRSRFEAIAANTGGRMTVELQSYVQQPASRIPVPTVITNVVATLKGRQPESEGRVYVVSGHYDSMCGDPVNPTCDAPGANDDASGVAAVLEMARVMSTRDFDATIVFMAVAGEEQGLYGSTYFATQAKAAGRNIAGMFTNDIIGSSRADDGSWDPFKVRVFAEGVPTAETATEANTRRSVGGENDSPSRQLARLVKDVGENSATGMKVDIIYRRDRYRRGGDHIPFLQQGYAALRFTEPHENYAHQHQNVRTEDGKVYGDLPEFVDFAYITRVARVNAAALATLARAPAVPGNARIITAQLTNDTELAWDANPEPDVTGYEVVYRETTEPLWTHVIPVGNVTTYTVPGLSKDNYFFGVRAVDKDGYRGPVAFPKPAP
ncbi:M28 family metallopeptidase [Pyxidicoccus parkwayensis]|uniref:M28 family metallopeptidase n=1 Tax=Pyxidicoccus parkwayensis TaxID=2813578 RepID=A0ABX7NUN2_9BACT|nr:M28 family metallopeptidase [Pyxidicoccus parkwaysis]QSQ22413.1 M28 family metallopeptidase [Pyxidicoccus parkwaysis]